MMTQDDGLIPWRNVEGNLAWAGIKSQSQLRPNELRQKSEDLLTRARLIDASEKFPDELSGGMGRNMR